VLAGLMAVESLVLPVPSNSPASDRAARGAMIIPNEETIAISARRVNRRSR
jgi:hypothetical protein